jgi:prevent-host-death family protein
MRKVGISELRQHLPSYLAGVQKGEPIEVTHHGKVIARIVPGTDAALEARKRLAALRKTARVGDVMSPIGEPWEAGDGRL